MALGGLPTMTPIFGGDGLIIPGFEPGKPVDQAAFTATHGARPGALPLKPLVTVGPGDGLPGLKPPVGADGPAWMQAAEIIQRPGEHPRLKRDSGAWAGRKPQQGGQPQQGNLRMGGI